MKILVVEDEKKIASFIKTGLEEEKFLVDVAFDGEEGYEKATNNTYDLILLDIMLPKKNGLELLKELRSESNNTPVILLTALGTTENKVEGLDSGADDYLPKPFSFDELTSRIRAVLRRSSNEKTTQLVCGEITLDTVTHIAIKNGLEIDLTTKEYLLLEYLMRNKNKIISRINITQQVWKNDFEQESNIIDVYIKRLRNKIDGESEKPYLQSIRGVGYRLRDTIN